MMEEPLYIFFDLEAAHSDRFFGDIIEIAAQVDPRMLENEVFSSLVNTKQNLAYFVIYVCKITADMLKDQPYFPDVFNNFMKWIQEKLVQCAEKYGKNYYPVLVAHGGFDADFMMIQGNLERNEMGLDVLSKGNLRFGDTYLLARKLRTKGLECLQECQLSIENLYKNFFPNDHLVGQHRALPDTQFMIRIFLESPLKDYFHEIPVATFKSRQEEYSKINTSKMEKQLLNDNLPKGLSKATHTMTLHRLLRNGLTYKRLQVFFETSVSYLDFYERLQELGIDRKAAKSMASRFSSMGLMCKGCREEYDERTDDLCTEKTNIERSDSGYESIPGEEDAGKPDYFYEMFVDEFFYPPQVYEVQFGSFTIEEIKKVDEEIDSLFEELYGQENDANDVEYELKEDASLPEESKTLGKTSVAILESKSCNAEISEADGVNQIFYDHTEKMQAQKREQYRRDEEKKYAVHKLLGSNEDWDSEEVQTKEEFYIPVDRGRLATSFAIGMTIDDINGEIVSTRLSANHDFAQTAFEKRPDGGIAKPKGKVKAKIDKIRERKRKKNQMKEMGTELYHNPCGRTVIKDDEGELFVLL